MADLLRTAHAGLDVELVGIETLGDRAADRPIWELGDQGVFVREVQAAVLEGRADAAVHSAKDLPSNPSLALEGLVIGAVPPRHDARDALVGLSLDAIPVGGTVGTGSVRRRAQLADRRPDLTFAGLRGNIGTRLAKAGRFSAVVVAAAALHRLGLSDRIAEVLDPSVMLPQVGQGALAVECRADDDGVLSLLADVEDGPSRRAVEAERAYLATLGGGCELPAGAHAAEGAGGELHLEALLASLDGRVVLRASASTPAGADPSALGRRLGEELVTHGGGRSLLDDVGVA